MGLVRSDLLGQINTGNFGTGNFTSSSFTPPGTSVMLVGVFGTENSGIAPNAADMSVTSSAGYTFTPLLTLAVGSTFATYVGIFRAIVVTGTLGTVTASFNGRNMSAVGVSVAAWTGYNASTPTGATASGQQTAGFTTPNPATITLSGAPASTSEVWGIIGADKSTADITPGTSASFIETTDQFNAPANITGGFETEVRGSSTSTTVKWDDVRPGGGALFNWGALAVEVLAQTEADGAATLTATSSMTATGVVEVRGAATLTATGSLTAAAAAITTNAAATLTATGSLTAAGTVVQSGVQDTLVAPTLRQILACMAATVASVPNPPAHYRVVPGIEVYPALGTDGNGGVVVLDECCEGVAWVRMVDGPYPTAEFPNEEAWYPDHPTSLAITVEMGVLRCGGGPGIELAPTDAQWGADAQAVEDDKAALRRAFCCIEALIQSGPTLMQDVVYGPGRWQPAQGDGNCMGGSLQVTVQLPYCCGL